MIETWNVAPPHQPAYITRVTKLDMDLFENQVLCASSRVGTLSIDDPNSDDVYIVPAQPSLVSLGQSYRYIVEMSDGEIGRATLDMLSRALEILHQEWPEGS